MATRHKEVQDLRDRDLDRYIAEYANELVREYEMSWSHKGWSMGAPQLDKLRRYVVQKVRAQLTLSIELNYAELDRVVGMTPEEMRKARIQERARLKREYGW